MEILSDSTFRTLELSEEEEGILQASFNQTFNLTYNKDFSDKETEDFDDKQTEFKKASQYNLSNMSSIALKHLKCLRSIYHSCFKSNPRSTNFYKKILKILSQIDKDTADRQIKFICSMLSKKALEILIHICEYNLLETTDRL